MTIKYFCPKCHKCFVEWGAKKTGFKCLACNGEDLKLLDAAELLQSANKTKLKKGAPKIHQPVPIGDAFNAAAGISDAPMDDDEFEEGETEGVEDVIEGVDEFGTTEEVMPLIF